MYLNISRYVLYPYTSRARHEVIFRVPLSVVVNQPSDRKAGGGEPAATPRGGNTNYSSCSTTRQQDAHNSTHDQR